MDDVPWIYVVMIFIAFVSWVSNRVKEAAEYRRARKAERAAAERARRTTQAPEYDSPYRDQRQTHPDPEPIRPQSYEEIFEELERRVTGDAEEEPEPGLPAAPPPLPGKESTPPIGSMPDLPEEPIKPSAPIGVRKKKRRNASQQGDAAAALTRVLRDGKQLQNALILKEVLDKPVSLRR